MRAVYDNPNSGRREWWESGTIIYFLTAMLMAQDPDHPYVKRSLEAQGPWKAGQFIGDVRAINIAHRPSRSGQTWIERANSYAGSRMTSMTIPSLQRDIERLQCEIEDSGTISQDQLEGRQMLELYLEQVMSLTRPCRR